MLNVRALLVSTYELGHQPFGLASPAAWLRRDGVDVRCADLTKERLGDEALTEADLIGVHLPMHTATRLAAGVIRRAHTLNPHARLIAYGLYAPLNADWLRSLGVTDVLDGEFEADLAAIARELRRSPSGPTPRASHDPRRETPTAQSAPSSDGSADHDRQDFSARPAFPSSSLPKLRFIQPDRSGLPPLTRYATLRMGDGTSRVAGHTEASRGCRHLCRHCPIVPVYHGQFRIVQPDVVLADIDAQIAAGAGHITFGDPDFFNGPTHAIRIVRALHERHPSVSYDVTIKIEHLLQHRDLLPALRETGCLFVTSAVESLDDQVLALLDKGHTRAGFVEAVALCREAGLNLVPTFVAFHPWTSAASYCDLLDTIESLDLVDHVAPIQLAIRLLVPSGSRMLELAEMQAFIGAFDGRTLTFRWAHPDPAIDRLQADISAIVGRQLSSGRRELFDAISDLAHARAGLPRPAPHPAGAAAAIPYMDEPWYCCAEPNPEQLTLV